MWGFIKTAVTLAIRGVKSQRFRQVVLPFLAELLLKKAAEKEVEQ